MPERCQIVRHRSEHSAWDMVRPAVPPDLAPYLQGWAGFRELLPSPLPRHEAATAKFVLVISFGAPFELLYRHASAAYDVTAGSFVAGLHDQAAQNRSTGLSHCLQADFTPLGARLFFDRPLYELTNRITELSDLLGGEAPRLEERLWAAPDWEARFEILAALVRGRLALAAAPDRAIVWALRRLEASGGGQGIGALAAELGVSRKHLAQRFRSEVGLAPKLLGRVLRFQRALRLLDGGSGGSLAQLSLEAGYYDQAHFNRDFRTFAGFAPREYLARLSPQGEP